MMFKYDANGSGQTEYKLSFSENTSINLLVVAGGWRWKSQGNDAIGGRSGGLLYIENQDVTKDTEYIIKVGKEVMVQTTSADAGYSGEDSSFDSIIAVGGGGVYRNDSRMEAKF